MSQAPRILISAATAQSGIAANYERAICAAGGIPVVQYAPPLDLNFDGLLLTGGGDIDPSFYGQTPCGSGQSDPLRDSAELALTRACLDAQIPVLGICRGEQVLNVAMGGTMVQDLGERLNPFHQRHADGSDALHTIHAQHGSVLFELYGALFVTNSSHHQAVDNPGQGVAITAHSEGGVTEAIELPGRYALGVQFHPERMTGALQRPGCVDGGAVFRWFIDLCRKCSKLK